MALQTLCTSARQGHSCLRGRSGIQSCSMVLLVSGLPGQPDAQGPGPVPRPGASLQHPEARELRAPASEDPGGLLVRLSPRPQWLWVRGTGLGALFAAALLCSYVTELCDGWDSGNKGEKQAAEACVAPWGGGPPSTHHQVRTLLSGRWCIHGAVCVDCAGLTLALLLPGTVGGASWGHTSHTGGWVNDSHPSWSHCGSCVGPALTREPSGGP